MVGRYKPDPLEHGVRVHVGVCSMCDRAVVVSSDPAVVDEWSSRHLELEHPAELEPPC